MSVKGYENEIYALQTRHTSYIIRVGEDRIPENVYWGKRIDRIEDFAGEASPVPVNMQAPHCLREECASFGGMRFKESSMKVCFADGVRDFRVGRVYAETEENRLELVLEDECYPFRVRLCYEVFEEEDVIKKWRIVENTGEAPVVLERIFSAQFGLPGTGYESLNYNGRWGMEFQAVSEKITSRFSSWRKESPFIPFSSSGSVGSGSSSGAGCPRIWGTRVKRYSAFTCGYLS